MSILIKNKTCLLLLSFLSMVLLVSCNRWSYLLKKKSEFIEISDNNYPSKEAIKKHRLYFGSGYSGWYRSNEKYTPLQCRLLKDSFHFEVKEALDGYKYFYCGDTLVTHMFAGPPVFDGKNKRVIIHGSDSTNKAITLYVDGDKHRLWNNGYAYEYWGDTLLFIDRLQLAGWGWGTFEDNKAPSIYRFDEGLNTIDTLFTIPGLSGGLLANAIPVNFDVVDNKWIWEWANIIYAERENIITKYDTLDGKRHYTFLNGKEFFFYQHGSYEEGYRIFYDGRLVGRLGYDWLTPLNCPKTRVEFLGKKGHRLYKVTLTEKKR